jgi:hypothetical protein
MTRKQARALPTKLLTKKQRKRIVKLTATNQKGMKGTNGVTLQ